MARKARKKSADMWGGKSHEDWTSEMKDMQMIIEELDKQKKEKRAADAEAQSRRRSEMMPDPTEVAEGFLDDLRDL